MKLTRRECLAAAAIALPSRAEEPAAGKLLVAARTSRDPDFAGSVILLIHYSAQGAIGLMINRPWEDVPIARLFPELKESKVKLWLGGPVAIGVRALLRSRTRPEEADRLLGDVYVTASVKRIEQRIAANPSPDVFRVYAGSAGWSSKQLQGEVARGLWRVMPADAALVFDPRAATLWLRLSGR
jgi:putative transcriptional regulator